MEAFNHPEKAEEFSQPGAILDDVEANLWSNPSTKGQPGGFFASAAREWHHVLRRGLRSEVFALSSSVGVDFATRGHFASGRVRVV